MGRISNVIGLRQRKYYQWLSVGNWIKKNNTNVFYTRDIKNMLDTIFKSESVIRCGFLISKISFFETADTVLLVLGIYQIQIFDEEKRHKQRLLSNNSARVTKVDIKRNLLLQYAVLSMCQSYFKNKKFKANIVFLSHGYVTALLIANYFTIKVRQKFWLGEVVYPVLRFMQKEKSVLGFRVDCSGRFTRKQRATFLSVRCGKTGFSTYKYFVDYEEASVILKFGKCGFKVWIYRSKPLKALSLNLK